MSVPPAEGSANGQVLGFSFTVSWPLEVTAVGAFDSPGGIVPVGLYEEGVGQVDNVLVDGALSTWVIDEFRYQLVVPYTLWPDTVYTLVGAFADSTQYGTYATNMATYSAGIHFLDVANEVATTLPEATPTNASGWSDTFASVNLITRELPCSGNGTCDESTGVRVCACYSPWSGDACEIP